MERQYEAYYSKHSAWIFLFVAIMIPIAMILSVVFWPDSLSWMRIMIATGFTIIMLILFFVTYKKDGIAIEVTDRNLILHKKTPVMIPLNEITQVSMNDGNGSFDMSIKTQAMKYSIHCFVKEQRIKKDQLITLLKNEGIRVITFDLSSD